MRASHGSYLSRTLLVAFLLGVPCAPCAPAQENGNLQIHFMNVGQGDGAVLISPLGEVVLFDNGVRGFTLDIAQKYARTVPLRPGVKELLGVAVEKYLISSGPDYFVATLASGHGIPAGNVLASRYLFDSTTALIAACDD